MNDALMKRMEEIRTRYIRALPDRLEGIDVLVRAVVGGGEPAACQQLFTELHNLGGTASTHDLAGIGGTAEEMAELIRPFRRIGNPPRPVKDGLALLAQDLGRESRKLQKA